MYRSVQFRINSPKVNSLEVYELSYMLVIVKGVYIFVKVVKVLKVLKVLTW